MKRKLLILCCLFPLLGFSQEIGKPFFYPAKPGTKEWAELRTEKQKFNAFQIPDDTLNRLGTKSLVITCLNLPSFGYITAYENLLSGYFYLLKKCNGLRELEKRKDAEKFLIEIYSDAGDSGLLKKNKYLEIEYWPIKLSWMEVLLSQECFIESLNITEKKNLLLLAKNKLEMKQSSDKYGIQGFCSTALLMARVLHSLAFSDFENEVSRNRALENFIETSCYVDQNQIQLILDYSNKYLNK